MIRHQKGAMPAGAIQRQRTGVHGIGLAPPARSKRRASNGGRCIDPEREPSYLLLEDPCDVALFDRQGLDLNVSPVVDDRSSSSAAGLDGLSEKLSEERSVGLVSQQPTPHNSPAARMVTGVTQQLESVAEEASGGGWAGGANESPFGEGPLKKGAWDPKEDDVLRQHVTAKGAIQWNTLRELYGLRRSGKSCRLRYLNHLAPDLKRGGFSPEEEALCIELQARFGNKWAKIAAQMPGRTDNEVKNLWHTKRRQAERLEQKNRDAKPDPELHRIAREQNARAQIARHQMAREQNACDQMVREQMTRERKTREQIARGQIACDQMLLEQIAHEQKPAASLESFVIDAPYSATCTVAPIATVRSKPEVLDQSFGIDVPYSATCPTGLMGIIRAKPEGSDQKDVFSTGQVVGRPQLSRNDPSTAERGTQMGWDVPPIACLGPWQPERKPHPAAWNYFPQYASLPHPTPPPKTFLDLRQGGRRPAKITPPGRRISGLSVPKKQKTVDTCPPIECCCHVAESHCLCWCHVAAEMSGSNVTDGPVGEGRRVVMIPVPAAAGTTDSAAGSGSQPADSVCSVAGNEPVPRDPTPGTKRRRWAPPELIIPSPKEYDPPEEEAIWADSMFLSPLGSFGKKSSAPGGQLPGGFGPFGIPRFASPDIFWNRPPGEEAGGLLSSQSLDLALEDPAWGNSHLLLRGQTPPPLLLQDWPVQSTAYLPHLKCDESDLGSDILD